MNERCRDERASPSLNTRLAPRHLVQPLVLSCALRPALSALRFAPLVLRFPLCALRFARRAAACSCRCRRTGLRIDSACSCSPSRRQRSPAPPAPPPPVQSSATEFFSRPPFRHSVFLSCAHIIRHSFPSFFPLPLPFPPLRHPCVTPASLLLPSCVTPASLQRRSSLLPASLLRQYFFHFFFRKA